MAQSRAIPYLTPKQEERFWAKVAVPYQPSCCWEWQSACHSTGYARLSIRGVCLLAYRVSYTLLIGRIPAGMTIDHLCRNRKCVNPDHLQPVSLANNIYRGYNPPAMARRQTHCKHGHAFTPENTHVGISSNGKERRRCRKCDAEKCRRMRVRRHERLVPRALCVVCGTDFLPRTRLNICCSDVCRATWVRQRDRLQKRNRRVALEQAA
jgi:predicted nucleic acid-binding Zn ribbon protein